MTAQQHSRGSGRFWVLFTLLFLASIPDAHAQRSTERRQGRFEFGIGIAWTPPSTLGEGTATLTENRGSTGGPFRLFDTATQISSSWSVQADVAIRLWRELYAAGGGSAGRLNVTTTFSDDLEAAAGVPAASAQLSQFIVDGRLILRLTRWAFANQRAVPFVQAGSGFVRELDEERTSAANSGLLEAGGGLTYWVRRDASGWFKNVGLRADARSLWIRAGIVITEAQRRLTSVGISVVLR